MINLDMLAAGTGFTAAQRHIKTTLDIIEGLKGRRGKFRSLGDILFEMGNSGPTGDPLALLLRMVLVDKLGYTAVSANLAAAAADTVFLAGEFSRWNAVDMLAVYHHPDRGILAANPKNACALALFGPLKKRELLVMYAGKGEAPPDGQCEKAARLALALFEGARPKIPADLYRGGFTARTIPNLTTDHTDHTDKRKKKKKFSATELTELHGYNEKDRKERVCGIPVTARKVKQPGLALAAGKAANKADGGNAAVSRRRTAETEAGVKIRRAAHTALSPANSAAAAAPAGPVRMTPMYSVVVQNELFHNGNVEAWKRIIESYNAKYPALQVYIYYEGERILDINSLFSWGKVKHGSAIQFAVAGYEIRDVSKLQRCLEQGASRHFEAFLRGGAGTVLRLF
ncbi:hypothetical protein FACS1894124_5450 [Spirochaetia bacterium]|nr:hypothetical protein FACS1894124_5450 [Spirochaetia bacterium]